HRGVFDAQLAERLEDGRAACEIGKDGQVAALQLRPRLKARVHPDDGEPDRRQLPLDIDPGCRRASEIQDSRWSAALARTSRMGSASHHGFWIEKGRRFSS